MTASWISDTKWFLAEAGKFVFIVSILVYLVIFIINTLTDNFITVYFNFSIILVVSVASGFLFVLTKE